MTRNGLEDGAFACGLVAANNNLGQVDDFADAMGAEPIDNVEQHSMLLGPELGPRRVSHGFGALKKRMTRTAARRQRVSETEC